MGQIDSLALFPLADVVLLPEVAVPLYIFEPRYRQMTRDALDGAHQIGMVAVRPDSVAGMAGDPRIFEIGCVGQIAHAQERPDGTFQIMLEGSQRFRILEEAPREEGRLYRSARVALLEDIAPSTDEEHKHMVRVRGEMLTLLEELIRRTGSSEDPEHALETFAQFESARLVNALTQSIAFSPIEKQQLLEADSLTRRCETMAELLRFRLADTGMGGSLPN